MKEETANWFGIALSDLEVAREMFRLKRYEYAAFWCQQAVEKALKAIQVEKENKFDKTHDLVLLSQKVGAPQNTVEICKKLLTRMCMQDILMSGLKSRI